MDDKELEEGELNDIEELQEIGISVWGQDHQLIEEQAIAELEKLQETKHEEKPNSSKPKKPVIGLDLERYIESQKQLQLSKKPKVVETGVSEHSLEVARKVAQKEQDKFEAVGTKRKKQKTEDEDYEPVNKKIKNGKAKRKKLKLVKEDEDYELVDKKISEESEAEASGSEYVPSEDEDEEETKYTVRKERKSEKVRVEKVKDDGNIFDYNERIRMYEDNEALNQDDEERPSDKALDYNLICPGSIWSKLYRYQKIGVKWMNELNNQKVGGLLGDEMGLGKTVQVIAFLAAMKYSRNVSEFRRYKGLGPTLIVAPATVLHQWVRHFHEWWPPLRVAILHQSGTFTGLKTTLIREVNKNNGVLLTTYQGILRYKGLLSELFWHYIILDEGHKIRNPTAKVTIAIKQLQTPHRLVLTGSPMQNNLQELWSLFDFIVPGKLGLLQAFMDHFATPIVQGGYVNATPIQEATALSIATALKNMITPFMLRRAKADVNLNLDLPSKTEQVLFCELTTEQRDLYKGYLLAEHVSGILDRGRSNRYSNNQFRAKMLMAVTVLRKICNHPDLYLGELEESGSAPTEVPIEERYGYYRRSGKMKVVAALLGIWKRQGHRVLLFTQSRTMIEIFEEFLKQEGYSYLKMDGGTSIGSRQGLIDKFNVDSSYLVFLLTTRVGGLGINLTGANRVVIYDPDWNPATDLQARERAWRIGQLKQVTVYRLLSAGTIEEKMYQRQVWKQLLSNKVLSDPSQKRFFKTSDLHELFSLNEPRKDQNTETSNIFQDSKVEIGASNPEEKSVFSKDKINAMKQLAQKLAKTIKPADKDPVIICKGISSKSLDGSSTKKEEPENFVWDPTTVRFKQPRKIILPKEEVLKNCVDGKEVNVSFNDILGKLETMEVESVPKEPVPKEEVDVKLVEENVEIATTSKDELPTAQEVSHPKKHKKKKKKHKERDKEKEKLTVDGERVEGVVKREKSKKKEVEEEKGLSERQDEYVLMKLFNKGVHTALKHDSIVGSSSSGETNLLKTRSEADRYAKAALKALKNSRVRNWRW